MLRNFAIWNLKFKNYFLKFTIMKKLEKIKLKDLVKGESLNVKQISQIKGGASVLDGCYSGVCTYDRSTAEPHCAGAAWCTHGVG
jgi:natural product precursor